MGHESRARGNGTRDPGAAAPGAEPAQRTPEESRHEDVILKLDAAINIMAGAASLQQVQHQEELIKQHEDASGRRFDMLTAQLDDVATLITTTPLARTPPPRFPDDILQLSRWNRCLYALRWPR